MDAKEGRKSLSTVPARRSSLSVFRGRSMTCAACMSVRSTGPSGGGCSMPTQRRVRAALAILFLRAGTLYAAAVRSGHVDARRRAGSVAPASPSTMLAPLPFRAHPSARSCIGSARAIASVSSSGSIARARRSGSRSRSIPWPTESRRLSRRRQPVLNRTLGGDVDIWLRTCAVAHSRS